MVKGLKFKLTATVGKRKRFLGTFNRPSSVDKIIDESKRLNKKFPTTDKKRLLIVGIRGKKITSRRAIKLN
jgi:hypothetical protein